MRALDVIDWRNLKLVGKWEEVLRTVEGLPGVQSVYPGGSRYIGGHTADSDVDIVVYGNFVGMNLEDHGYTAIELDRYEGEDIRSWRKGKLNLIVHVDRDKYLQTIAATELCRVHGVDTKDGRYAVHEEVKGEQA